MNHRTMLARLLLQGRLLIVLAAALVGACFSERSAATAPSLGGECRVPLTADLLGATVIVLMLAMAIFAPLLVDENPRGAYQMPRDLTAVAVPPGTDDGTKVRLKGQGARGRGDVIVALIFGGLGYLMVRFGWPRAPLVLGLVLGNIVESYLWVSTARYGAAWLTRPGVLVLIALACLMVAWPFFQERRIRARAR